MEQIVFNNVRVQLLSEDIIRIERAKKGAFCDENTFFIPNRTSYREPITYTQEENVICLGDYELYIPENSCSLSGVRLEKNGKKVYGYKKQANTGEIPTLDKTPEVFALSDTPRITVPEGGYSQNRKGQYKVEENVQDIYLLLCCKDAKKLRKLYVELTGRPELVRLSTLGGWNSKYYAYSEETAKQLILDYEAHNVPLDNMVIDTDWRSCEHGWGYDINTKLFPNMKRFLDFAHAHNIDIMFNDHPEPVDGAHVFRAKEIAYREKNLQSLMNIGMDTWWYDRNWSTSLISPSENLRWETLGLYLFHEITKHYYQKESGNEEIYRRPDIMGNAVNIANGIYLGISDSASHCYGIQWTGDIASSLADLKQEVETLLKAGNNCISYINADCGGHTGDPNKSEFVRWMQFGTLSPIFRPHCTNYVQRFREPWLYDEETLNIVREYTNLRYRLLPILYASAYEAYENGAPIFKSLGWCYPQDKRAVKCDNAYLLGQNVLIRPIAGNARYPVTAQYHSKPVTATYYDGCKLQGAAIAKAEYDCLHMQLNHTAPEKGVPVYDFSARFETEVCFEHDVELILCCDDGATVYIDGEKVLEDDTFHAAKYFPLKVIAGKQPHKIVIDYFQGGGEAFAGLYYSIAPKDNKTDIYLPVGRWLDPFDGKIYEGGKTVRKEYGLRQMPLFIRCGALIPLAHNAHNTKEQTWDDLVLDFYPDKNACDSGYLYEDDTETTAYKLGLFRKSGYDARYDVQENAFVIRLHAAQGEFAGEKCFDKRNITVKFHQLKGIGDVRRVTVNGAEQKFARKNKAADTFPMSTEIVSPDAKVAFTRLEVDAKKEYEIKFHLG